MKRLIAAICFAALPALVSAGAAAPTFAYNFHAAPYVPVCAAAPVGYARCSSDVVTDSRGTPLASTLPAGYGPAQFHGGYNLPCTVSGSTVSSSCSSSTYGGQIIGIVDAYNDPTVASDLNTYDSTYGINACPQGSLSSSSACLTVVNQTGGSSLPRTDAGWALEISLDVQTAHQTCQTCKVLLVEASSNSNANLGAADKEAANLGATEISNSYGGGDSSSDTSYDSYYTHSGIAVTASSGDSGYGAQYPAASPDVVSVGGTTLNLTSGNGYSSESAWSSGGSGCSSYETANPWQTTVSDWASTGCGTKRGIADVSADADPNTGAAVYDSTRYQGRAGWFQVGGTSLSSPLIASVFALAGGTTAINAQSVPYSKFTGSNSHDVTTGSNGTCGGTIMCSAAIGYDGPTGLGTPNGTAGF